MPSESAGAPPDDGADQGGSAAGPPIALLIVVLAVAFVVVPGLILLRPPGLPFEVAFLVLPLLPAVLLGVVAVWTAVASGEFEE